MGPEIAIGAAQGLAQAYVTEKARGAAQKRLDEIEDMFNGIVPPQYDIKIYDDPKLLAGVPAPAFNMAGVTPEAYQVVDKYAPKQAAFIKGQAPELVKASESAGKGRQAQMDALQKYRDIVASGGMDPSMQDKYNLASQQANSAAQSRQQSVLQDAARRGQAGSGSALAAQLQGGSDAMQRQAMMSGQMASDAYQNQLSALRQSAALGGDIRSSEMGEAGRNADIINQFNQKATSRYQDYLNQQADADNQAQLRNLQNSQDVANRNTGARNSAQESNLDRYNNLQGRQYDVGRQQIQDRLAMTASKNNALSGQFNNQMSQANARAGIGYKQADQQMQTGRDRAQQIQGAFDVGRSAYTSNQNDKFREKEAKAKYGDDWSDE